MDWEARCDEIVARQNGVIARTQALAAGMTLGILERRVTSGVWIRLHPGVYSPRAVPGSWQQRMTAAVLFGGPDAYASHRSAARLWGLNGFTSAAIEVTLTSSRRVDGARPHRRAKTDPVDLVQIAGIRTTAIERTLADLAAVLPEERVGVAVDDALHTRLTTLDAMVETLNNRAARGRTGIAALRRLVEGRDGRAAQVESQLEASMLRIIRAHRLPEPKVQYRVVEEGQIVARLDFAYPSVKLGIETDGFRWHGGRERWARDMRRENQLKLLGWSLLRFSWEDVHECPESVARQVRAALEGTHLIHPCLTGVDRKS